MGGEDLDRVCGECGAARTTPDLSRDPENAPAAY
jgi:hypothetical protein